MKKRLLAAVLAVMMLVLSGCGDKENPEGNSDSSTPEDENFPVVVMNEDIPAAPNKVVSLSPGTTEMLFAMGYGSRVVGVSEFDDYPAAEVDKRHKCGSVLTPDLERIAELEADLVVAAANLIESDLVLLQQQNIPVVILPYADSLAGLKQNYIAMATAMEGKAGAETGATYWATLEDKLSDAAALAQGDAPVAILLREMDYSMATGDTFEQELFDAVGLTNDAKRFTNWLYDRAEVAALEPEVIFVNKAIDPDTVKQSAVYKPVAAVKNDRIMTVDLAVFERQSPRMFDTLLEMAEFAYPQD